MNRFATVVMTRQRTWMLTAISVALFVLLSWIFADGLFRGPLWNAEDWVSSPLITYLLIGVIVLVGWYQVRSLPEEGVSLSLPGTSMTPGQVEDPISWRLLLGNVFFALFWLPVRFFVGRDWLSAGWHKVVDPEWTQSGVALQSYWERAAAIPESGRPPITYDWFRQFLQYMLDNGWYTWFAKLIAWGEVLVGLGLLVGALVGIAAFFGTVMNFSFMLAGSASSNPVLFGLAVFLVLAWKVAGFWGLDRWLLPMLGTPWQRGALLGGEPVDQDRAAGNLRPQHG
ncbi:MAG: DoxX family protein [Thermomicrobiales bacterium]|jgi:thiosulfate dehydrogenase (quinone) large subunit|nr:DoxX family protein [Thermomicrobiales bacterium]MDF3018269.1 DoxX family protein [Thermomicrobiales bacterium]